MALTPEEDAKLGEVQRAHTSPEAYKAEDAIAGEVVVKGDTVVTRAPKAPDKQDETGWRGAITLKGKRYRLADEIGAMPLLMWASVSEMSTEDNGALAAIYNMLGDCIHEDHWNQFRWDAIKSKAQTEELLDVITGALEILTANPTESSSSASAGSAPTSAASKAGSSSPRARASRSSRRAS